MAFKNRVATFVVLCAAAMIVVQLQWELTYSPSLPDSRAHDLEKYYSGSVLFIFRARVFMRLLLMGCLRITAGHPGLFKVNLLLQFLFTFGALVLLNKSAKSVIAPLVAAIFIPWGFLTVGYGLSLPYDLPAFFFSAVGLCAILESNFKLLLLVVLIGTLNRETTVYLIPAYLIAEWPSSRSKSRLLIATAILAVAYVLTYEIPRILLHAGPVTAVTKNGNRLLWLANIKDLGFHDRSSIWQNVWWVLALHVPAMVSWRDLPWRLRAAYLSTPFFLLPILVFSNIYELRLYNELIPMGSIAMATLCSRQQDSLAQIQIR